MSDEKILEKANASLMLSDVFKFNEYANAHTELDGIKAAYLAGYVRGYKQAAKDASAKRATK
jgi:hypothetical protein